MKQGAAPEFPGGALFVNLSFSRSQNNRENEGQPGP
jgi:hypothetical protein